MFARLFGEKKPESSKIIKILIKNNLTSTFGDDLQIAHAHDTKIQIRLSSYPDVFQCMIPDAKADIYICLNNGMKCDSSLSGYIHSLSNFSNLDSSSTVVVLCDGNTDAPPPYSSEEAGDPPSIENGAILPHALPEAIQQARQDNIIQPRRILSFDVSRHLPTTEGTIAERLSEKLRTDPNALKDIVRDIVLQSMGPQSEQNAGASAGPSAQSNMSRTCR